jgi:hypothetical protein
MPTCASCGKWARWDSIQLERFPGYQPTSLRFCRETCLFLWLTERAEYREKHRKNDEKSGLELVQI